MHIRFKYKCNLSSVTFDALIKSSHYALNLLVNFLFAEKVGKLKDKESTSSLSGDIECCQSRDVLVKTHKDHGKTGDAVIDFSSGPVAHGQ
jgi:hypothetical protein